MPLKQRSDFYSFSSLIWRQGKQPDPGTSRDVQLHPASTLMEDLQREAAQQDRVLGTERQLNGAKNSLTLFQEDSDKRSTCNSISKRGKKKKEKSVKQKRQRSQEIPDSCTPPNPMSAGTSPTLLRLKIQPGS